MSKVLIFTTSLLFICGISFSQTQFGDTLFSFNAGQLTPTEDRTLFGVEFAEGYYWVTGMNPPYYDHRLYKINPDDNSLVSFTSLGTGYHAYFDLAYDGEYLYATDRDSIVQIDLTTGLPTGERIFIDFDYLLAQGLAYDPATDHFWIMPQRNGQLQIIYEIDRDGNVLNSYPNKNTDYTVSLAWDTLSPNGPFLWAFSREEIGYDSRGVMRQFSPATGQFTGVEIEMKKRSPYVEDGPLGIAFTPDLDSSIVTMIALQSGALEFYDGLDWIVVYNADLRNQGSIGPEINVDPLSIQLQLQYEDSLDVPVYISNSGTTILEWRSFIENTDSSAFPEGELGDVLFNFDLIDLIGNEDVRINGLTYARNHFWLAGYIYSTQQKLIYKIDKEGTVVNTYPQASSNTFGWSAITSDDDFIYAPDTYTINIWSLDSNKIAGIIPIGSISSEAITYDPNQKYFYVSGSTGAIRIIDREGEDVALLVTPYYIEDLAWDNFSPGGPFLWAWVRDDILTNAKCKAVRLDPQTGIYTGVSFEAENFGSFVNFPEAATIYPDQEQNKLIFAGIQEDDEYPGNESFLVGYDLDVVPPPEWIHLFHPTLGVVEPGETDTLFVRFHAMMSDTTTEALIKIYNNDLNQPLIEIPITFEMLENSVTSAEENISAPIKFSLEQNYPNPFNPSTTIRYTIKENSLVSLKIYDVLGNEVATLVNEVKPAGNYSVNFNSVGLTSGVYFYKLSAGNQSTSSGQVFTETKKMILLK